MDSQLTLILVVVSGAASLLAIFWLLREQFPQLFYSESKNLRRLTQTQTALGLRLGESEFKGPSDALLKSINETQRVRSRDARLTIRKRLKYAQWKISPLVFHGYEICLSSLVYALLIGSVNILILFLALFSGPLIMRTLLTSAIDRRHRRFDADYPQLLMSIVGLLKTGMTIVQALDAASKGLDSKSLVRQEIYLMIERLRLGVSEDRSIGAFGEDIYHPEIELFVQALILSRRVGGNLSDTIERIAKQVRKRQFFKSSAEAAISLQRGSLWVIIGIMGALQCFLALSQPDMVFKALETSVGWQVWQGAFALVVVAIVWIRRVTRMKI